MIFKHLKLFITMFVIIFNFLMPVQSYAKVWTYQQITFNGTDDRYVEIENGQMAWWGWGDDGKLAIFFLDSVDGIIKNITKNKVFGHSGPPSLSNGQIAWRIYDWDVTQRYYLWDGNDIFLIAECPTGSFPPYWGYPPSYNSFDPTLHNGQIAYPCWDGNDYEIFLWDGSAHQQITDNLTDDYEPQIHDGKISWTGWSAVTNSIDVFYWDGNTIYNISNRPGKDEDSHYKDGKIVYCGIDYANDLYFDIFLWDGVSTSQVYYSPGNDFEPETHGSFIIWTSWPNGPPPSKPIFSVWDGYKYFNLMESPFDVWGGAVDGSEFIFPASDGNDLEIFYATYITGTYVPVTNNGITRDVLVSNNTAYIANGYGDLKIIDTSDLSNPSEIGQLFIDDGWESFALEKRDNYIFMANQGAGVKVVDVSDSNNPIVVQTLGTIDHAISLTLHGNYLYVGDRLGGLHIIDVSSPSASFEIGSLALNGSTYGIAIGGIYAYVANYDHGMQVIDISNPANPTPVSTYDTSGAGVWDIGIKGSNAYLLIEGEGIRVVDISDPYQPALGGELLLPNGSETGYFTPPLDISFVRDFAFITNGTEGIMVVDISDPTAPVIAERIDTSGFSWGFDSWGDYLFVADGLSGLQIIGISDYKSTTYENAEDGSIDGWEAYDNVPAGALISNVYDIDRGSRVIELLGSGHENGYRLRSEDLSKWHNTSEFVIEWSLKYSEFFTVYIDVETTAGHRFLTYEPVDSDTLGSGEYVYHGLGSGVIDGQWYTFERDLEADLQEAQPGETILEVNGFYIRGSGRVDDIKLRDSLPGNTDSDNDGMPDFFEIRYGLNLNDPADAGYDNDSDGLINLQEYQSGTDPTDSDTDKDGMPDGSDNCPVVPPVKIAGTSQYYPTLQSAYDAVLHLDTIQSQALILTENLNINQDKSVILEGGYDCDYTANTGVTTINGNITFNDGSVTIQYGTLEVQ